jgi:hypothetical protein
MTENEKEEAPQDPTSEALDSPEVARAKEDGRALSPEEFEKTRAPATVGEKGPGSRVREGEPVGSVKVVTLDPEKGKVVLRVPVYEGEDADEVRARAERKAARQREKVVKATAE